MKNLKTLLFSFLFLSFTGGAFAQIGFSAGYTSVGVDFKNETDLTAFAPSFFAGADYWFRLKNQRIEFYPGVRYLQSAKEKIAPSLNIIHDTPLDYNFNLASAKLDIRIYPLDFKGDCDCPTWSKDGHVVKKGFYIFATGSGGQITKKSEGGVYGPFEETNFLATYGGGIGLDIGLSDYFTISPFVSYEQSTDSESFLYKSKLSPLSAGIHAQYRWKKY